MRQTPNDKYNTNWCSNQLHSSGCQCGALWPLASMYPTSLSSVHSSHCSASLVFALVQCDLLFNQVCFHMFFFSPSHPFFFARWSFCVILSRCDKFLEGAGGSVEFPTLKHQTFTTSSFWRTSQKQPGSNSRLYLLNDCVAQEFLPKQSGSLDAPMSALSHPLHLAVCQRSWDASRTETVETDCLSHTHANEGEEWVSAGRGNLI